ncbi:MAG: hypothetical protein IPO01_12685 [Chitinophagaceae bacterium]|nr:hypothetical protein [Chitinophagaceae bacterium]MBK9486017.1 hypothetical protein [Chitinophagaceae bacterium]MBL0201486.1 hypothetical protein [Chitinophagaceae bacterium]
MKKLFILLLISFSSVVSFAQGIGKAELKVLQQKEDSLKDYSIKIIQGISAENRFNADSMFTRVLVRALKTKHSFHYPFDSLQTVSVLYSPDSVFRIFTWQLVINENVIRQHGAIQMKTYDGSLKLYGLIDKSDVTSNIADTIGNHNGWIGAIYYKIIAKRSSNQNYYTLLGFDENNIRSSRKIIEVLNFINDEPVFGGRYFSYENDGVFKSARSRYIMEYKKEAGPRLNYDKELDMIIVEHLVSESNQPNKKWTLIGDGDYEGFKWMNGKWVHVEKVFNVMTPDGQAPVPNPIRDPSGNLDENKLKGAEEPVPAKPKGKGDN